MMRHSILATAVVSICFCTTPVMRSVQAVTTRPAASNELLTSDEVHKLFDAGQYADALRAVARIIGLTGAAAAPYNRHEMLMLRAECQIQLHQLPAATGTAEFAKKEAALAHKSDDEMEAEALALLLQRSPAGTYTPLTAEVKMPIKLADRDKRKDAYTALYGDAKELFGRKTEAAEKGTSLPPYLEIAKLAPTLRVAEYGATKGTAESDAAIKDIADHAAKLVDTTLTDLDAKVDRISTEANRIVTETATVTGRNGQGYATQRSHKEGLTGTDAQDLNDIDATCKRVSPAMLEFVKAFPDQADAFKKLVSKAKDISAKSQKTLNADYLNM